MRRNCFGREEVLKLQTDREEEENILKSLEKPLRRIPLLRYERFRTEPNQTFWKHGFYNRNSLSFEMCTCRHHGARWKQVKIRIVDNLCKNKVQIGVSLPVSMGIENF